MVSTILRHAQKNIKPGGVMKDPQRDMYRKMMEIAGVKGGYHRDQIFAEDKRSDYLWCLHCQRTYRRGEYRDLDGIQM